MRPYLAGVLGVTLLIAGCGEKNDPLSYEPLPDPSIDWRPYVEQMIEQRLCSGALMTLLVAAGTGGADPIPFMERLIELDGCESRWAETLEWTESWRNNLPGYIRRTESREGMRRSRDQSGLPMARYLDQGHYRDLEIEFPPEMLALERRWIEFCEAPMDLGLVFPYRVRQDIFHYLRDDTVLLPEWEQRISECRPIGEDLRLAYRSVRNSYSTEALAERRLLGETIINFESTLPDLDENE